MFKFDLEQTQDIPVVAEIPQSSAMPGAAQVRGAQDANERMVRLEARVEALERALAFVTANSGALEALDACARTQKLAQLIGGAETAPAAAAQAAAPDSRSTLDGLSITAAFASLDLRVAEAAAAEISLGRNSNAGPPMIEIDASLIDKAFARPPPEKLSVRAALEDLHPKITERVTGTWRTGELLQYLKKLIVDERGDRAGFAPAVMSELLLLSAILEAPEEQDAWAANPRSL